MFTEESIKSKNIIKGQRKNSKKIIQNYDLIKSKIDMMNKALKDGNIKLIDKIFDEHWLEKKKLTKNMSNKKFDKMYRQMISKNLFFREKLLVLKLKASF